MPRIKGEELRKVTLNLFEEDVAWYEKYYGQGWSEVIRMNVRKHRLHRIAVDSSQGEVRE